MKSSQRLNQKRSFTMLRFAMCTPFLALAELLADIERISSKHRNPPNLTKVNDSREDAPPTHSETIGVGGRITLVTLKQLPAFPNDKVAIVFGRR